MNKSKTIETIIIVAITFIIIALCVTISVNADEAPVRTERQIALHEAADILRECGYADDSAVIQAIKSEWLQEQEDMSILAKTISHEADPDYCEWEHSVAVGVVILNRKASAYFPNTVKGVVSAPGQYLESYTYGFANIKRSSWEAAKAAMDGNHSIPSDVIWQAEFPQGQSVWKIFDVDTGWYKSRTYFCSGVYGGFGGTGFGGGRA